jgi:predicted kinase
LLKYEYENATVYITEPTEKHIENIKKATEQFMQKVIKEQIQNESRRNNRRAGVAYSHARRRDKQTKTKDK